MISDLYKVRKFKQKKSLIRDFSVGFIIFLIFILVPKIVFVRWIIGPNFFH